MPCFRTTVPRPAVPPRSADHGRRAAPRACRPVLRAAFAACALAAVLAAAPSLAAQVPVAGDAGFVRESTGAMPIAFLYLGAKAALAAPGYLLTLLAVALPSLAPRATAAALALVVLGHGVGSGLGLTVGIAGADAGAAAWGAASGAAVAALAFANLWRIRRSAWPRPVLAAMALLPGLILGLVTAAAFTALPVAADGWAGNAAAHALGGTLGVGLAAAAMLGAVRVGGRVLGEAAYPANVALMAAGLVLAGHDLAALTV